MTPAEARAALERLGAAEADPPDLAEAALLFAVIDAPAADLAAARAHLAALAAAAGGFAAAAPGTRAACLAALLAGRHGYAGDAETYDDLANANLLRVIERRRGLPVSLGILWIHTARAAGWPAWGIDFPAHFLVGIEDAGQAVTIDPFAGGRVPSAEDLRGVLARLGGAEQALHPGLFRRMSDRAVLLRLQNNVKLRRLRAGDLAGMLACVEDMLRLAPDAAPLWGEAAVANRRLGRPRAAIAAFERFVALAPAGAAAAEARAALHELRSTLH